MSQILYDEVKGPDGKAYRVSTIQTVAGGAPDVAPPTLFNPLGLKPSDFDSYLVWPYETMVFHEDSSFGLYHAPYANKEEASAGHTQVIEAIKLGSEWAGGVNEEGLPSTDPEQWRTRMAAK